MHEEAKSNDLQEIITQAIEDIKHELGNKFDPDHINLAELERKTGLSRSKLRTLQNNGFVVKPHGRTGIKSETTVLSGFPELSMSFLEKA